MLQSVARLGRKLLGRDDERPSRLHTRRGKLLPLGELLRVPGTLLARVSRWPSEPQPWMARGAVDRLGVLLQPETTVLELGSGSSTLWFAQRAGATTSLEDNEEWADRVAEMTRGLGNFDLRRVESLSQALAALEDPFDVVVVDHNESAIWNRVDSVRALKDRCSILVLDDSDRLQYAAVEKILVDWRVERFCALGRSPFRATETSIYFRP